MLKLFKLPLRGHIALAVLILNSTCVLLSRAAAFPDWTDCPVVCSCKWSSGKKSAFCPDAGLTSLPASLDPEMQILDLSGNSIPILQNEIFKRAGLVNLQKVYLRNAGIQEINPDAFKDMRILIEIDLSDNNIVSLEPNTFLGNERLKELTLSGNPLVTLKSHQFPLLKHLRTLELQRCALTQIHNHAFVSLTGLESLKLDGNYLTYLEVSTIAPLMNLKTLTLDSNQWSCDCKLKNFRTWLIPDIPRKIYSVSQICHSPSRLKGRHWEDAKSSDFACIPEVKIHATSLQEDIYSNFTLSCLITGDPAPSFWWHFNGSPLNLSKTEFNSSSIVGIINLTSTAQLYTDYINDKYNLPRIWSNITIYNATENNGGQYTCHALNIAGAANDMINIVVPRVFIAPTLSQTNNWFLWIIFISVGIIFLIFTTLFSLFCFCSEARKNNRHKKVKLQNSISFGDQEKKLLDLSVTTNIGVSVAASEPISSRGSLTNTCSSAEFELTERPLICDATTVTVERLRSDYNHSSNFKNISCTNIEFPPPPPQFTGGILPTGIFENIFMSMALSQDAERRYPDLLDIPVHTSSVINKYDSANPLANTPIISNFATLPRRTSRSSEIGPQYDNMGPRITATGSSTFSLTDNYCISSSPHTSVIKPPIEFVSL